MEIRAPVTNFVEKEIIQKVHFFCQILPKSGMLNSKKGSPKFRKNNAPFACRWSRLPKSFINKEKKKETKNQIPRLVASQFPLTAAPKVRRSPAAGTL
jgi:hypothetical protein